MAHKVENEKGFLAIVQDNQNEKVELKDYQKRMQNELNELLDKQLKLNQFIGTDKFKSLSQRDKTLLIKQLAFMDGYAYVLNLRMAYSK